MPGCGGGWCAPAGAPVDGVLSAGRGFGWSVESGGDPPGWDDAVEENMSMKRLRPPKLKFALLVEELMGACGDTT